MSAPLLSLCGPELRSTIIDPRSAWWTSPTFPAIKKMEGHPKCKCRDWGVWLYSSHCAHFDLTRDAHQLRLGLKARRPPAHAGSGLAMPSLYPRLVHGTPMESTFCFDPSDQRCNPGNGQTLPRLGRWTRKQRPHEGSWFLSSPALGLFAEPKSTKKTNKHCSAWDFDANPGYTDHVGSRLSHGGCSGILLHKPASFKDLKQSQNHPSAFCHRGLGSFQPRHILHSGLSKFGHAFSFGFRAVACSFWL